MWSVNEIISFVESKVMVRNATNELAYVAAMSSFQRIKKERRIENGVKGSKIIAHPSCSKTFNVFRRIKRIEFEFLQGML